MPTPSASRSWSRPRGMLCINYSQIWGMLFNPYPTLFCLGRIGISSTVIIIIRPQRKLFTPVFLQLSTGMVPNDQLSAVRVTRWAASSRGGGSPSPPRGGQSTAVNRGGTRVPEKPRGSSESNSGWWGSYWGIVDEFASVSGTVRASS